MILEDFEKIVKQHSLCPDDVLYNSNALVGEAGECANVVKKIVMAKIRPEWVQSNENKLPDVDHWHKLLKEELSDVFFYLARLAMDAGVTLEELMYMQTAKLNGQSNKYNRVFLK